MDTLSITKNEVITLLEDNQFEHLSRREQDRLNDYLQQILTTLQDAADRRQIRRTGRKRVRCGAL